MTIVDVSKVFELGMDGQLSVPVDFPLPYIII